MRNYYFILTIFFFACNSQVSDNDAPISDHDAEEKAIKLSKQLDSKTLNTLKKWNYFTRGGDNWQKISGDSVLYTCVYFASPDTTTFMVYRPERFIVDFPCSFSFDTLNYWRFSFKKYNDHSINIVGVDKNGRDITLATKQELNNLFTQSNPFAKLDSLNKLKDSLRIIGYHSNSKKGFGYFIQFYISREYILTYLPDSTHFDNDLLKKEFAKGKMINKNWNFRKIVGQIDNG